MNALRPSLKHARWGLLLLLVSMLCLFAGGLYSASTTAVPKEPTRSVGLPMDGRLQQGAALPKRGQGYEVMDITMERRHRFGTRELVQLVADAGAQVLRKHRGIPLQVGVLSRYRGGRIEHHGSHQNGRDVDFAFYMRDRNGNPAKPTVFIPFDKNGYSVEPAMKYRFDDQRNWALVSALLQSKRADVQWIFVSDALKRRLLQEAENAGAPASLVRRAQQILKQPKESAHWDHFHVRILCPVHQLPECRDIGPTWARSKR